MRDLWDKIFNQRNYTSLTIRRTEKHYRTLAKLRVFIVLIVYIVLLLVRKLEVSPQHLIVAILVGVYAALACFHTGLSSILSKKKYISFILDSVAIFYGCYVDGGLTSPFVSAYFLVIIVYAAGPSGAAFFSMLSSTLVMLIALHFVTHGDIVLLNQTLIKIWALAVFIRVLFLNDTRLLTSYASRDGLTHLYNHQYFFDQLHNLASPSSNSQFALIILDLDNFKEINDTYGHVYGDKVLKMVACTIMEQISPKDIAARYGGDEFAIILPGADKHLCNLVAERLLQEIVALGSFGSISIGAAYYPEDTLDVQTLVHLADQRMYAQKNLNRLQSEAAAQDTANMD